MTPEPAVVDCDVHHGWASRRPAALPRRRLEGVCHLRVRRAPSCRTRHGPFANPSDHFREGSYPPAGLPGTDLEFTLSDHIESCGIAAAILTHGEARRVDTNPNPYYAAAVAQAANDWLVRNACRATERLFGSTSCPTSTPSWPPR